jgi:hypothetical protein
VLDDALLIDDKYDLILTSKIYSSLASIAISNKDYSSKNVVDTSIYRLFISDKKQAQINHPFINDKTK